MFHPLSSAMITNNEKKYCKYLNPSNTKSKTLDINNNTIKIKKDRGYLLKREVVLFIYF
jgi:hypothetical protein